MALNVKPIGDRILVEPVEEKEVKKGGIIIPDTAKEKPQEGIVVALGTGKVRRLAFMFCQAYWLPPPFWAWMLAQADP